MRLRTAALLSISVVGLVAVAAGLSSRLLGAGLEATQQITVERLRAIGSTTGRALPLTPPAEAPALLAAVARDGQLEAAYLLEDSGGLLRPVQGSGPGAGQSLLNWLRVDPDRALRALRGEASVGSAYSLERADPLTPDEASAPVLAGYFPVRAAAGPQVLVLEAGAAFVTVPTRLRATAWAAGGVAAGLAGLCLVLLVSSLRTAAREQRLQSQAERGEALRQMAGMVAHEIRNPLGTIRVGVELLREQAGSPDIVADVLSEVDRLAGLTTEFLTLSRDPPLQLAPVDIAALCAEQCERLRREHPGDALRITCDGAPSARIVADADRVRQILQNLTRNAIEAMQGQGALTLTVERRRGGARVRVADTGPGIDAAARARLFAPFSTTKPGGTGLGLVLSRRFAERHGGTLTYLAPEPGARTPGGACFVLSLPSRPARELLGPAPDAADAATEGALS